MYRSAVSLILLFLTLLPCATFARDFQISEILVEGNRRVAESVIRAAIGAEPGDSVSLEQIDRDIRALFALGRFEDVTASIEDRDGRQVLVYQIRERPLVRTVRFVGREAFTEEKLHELSSLQIPSLYMPRMADRVVDALKKAYSDEGYYNVEIEHRLEVNDRNEATLVFEIREGKKILIRDIQFTGNTVISDKELQKVMETREKWFLSWLTGRGAYRDEILQNDLEILADQYYNRGYIQVKINEPKVDLVDDRYLRIRIEIDEGEQFRVGSVDIQGDLLRDKEELLNQFKLNEGDVFSRKQLRKDVLALNDLYADHGYAYVNVSPLTDVDPTEKTINLLFDIEQGVQVVIEQINITGNTKTRDKVIRREMELVEGDLFSSTKLRESRRLVNNLGFFEEVNISTAAGSDAAHMDLNVEIKERPTGAFTIGLGYSSVDGVLAQGSVSQTNFLGRGWKLNLAGSLGGRSTTYQLGLTQPYFLDTDLTVGFDLFNLRREWSDFSKKSTGGDVKFGFPVTTKTRAFFVYRYEEKEIYDVDSNASLIIREQEGASTISSISASLIRDVTDYRLDPSKGSTSTVSMEFAGLGGTEKFAKFEVDHRHFFPFKWDTVFSIRGHMGYIQEIGGKDIPIDERYFLGGLNTIRGFESRTVGPRIRRFESIFDPITGETVATEEDYEHFGGKKTAYLNFEYIFPLLKDMGVKGVVFFDTGNAWDTDEDYFSDMRYSVGTGFRWHSPMGPLRVEWGYNLSPRDGEPQSDFQFSVGSFF